jgi:hypothetical protein
MSVKQLNNVLVLQPRVLIQKEKRIEEKKKRDLILNN